jgi:hypothetical protein
LLSSQPLPPHLQPSAAKTTSNAVLAVFPHL